MKKRTGFIPAFLAVLALLGGCMNLLDPPGGGGGAGPGEKGRVEIQVEGGDRTALPSGGFDQYILRFDYPGAEGYTHGEVEWISRGTSVDLEPGEWTVCLDAYAGEEVSGTGSAAVTVNAGTVTPVTIRIGMNTDAKAQGTLKYKVSYPPAGVSHAYRTEVLTVRDTAGNPVGSPVAITNGTEGALQLDAGVYFVSVVINDTVQQAGAARTSAAHIYGGQETYLEIEIGEEEFTALAPVTVTAGLTASPAIMMERRRVTLYGGADPLDMAILGWDGGGVTLWAPSSMTRVYVRQELEIGGITLSGHLETVPMSGAGTEVSLDDTLYTINLDAGISSGAVTSAVPAAFEGNSVGVTVTPGDGKRLRPGSLKYNSEPIDEDETPYTFTMPPDPVTIYAEFADYGIRYVTRYGAGDWDGTSWENASNDLQKMMDELAAASLDDTAGYTGPYIVKLGAGPHRPKYEPMVPANPAVLDNYAYNDSREDFRDRAFILRPGVQVWGGYPEPGGNDDTRDPAANVSILSGDLDNSGSTPNMHDAYHVVLGVGTLAVPITDMTVLDGLTISGGNANGSGSLTVGTYSIERQNAGGIYNRNASPTLNRVMISGNTVEIDGGGMYNRDGSSPKLANVTISDNHITGGGGMYNYDSSPTLTDVTIGGDDPADKNAANCGGGVYNIDSSQMTMNGGFITGNTAYYGGGMYNGNGSSPVLTDVTISENEAAGGSNAAGGGMFNYDNSSPVLTNVIIDRNNSYDAGGGMFNYDNSSPVLANVTISNNNTSNAGGGRMYNGSSSPVLANVTISGNTATISKLGGGGGMYNANGSSPVLINVRISGNKVTSSVSDRIGGGGMYNYLNSSPVLINVTIAGNYADVVTGADRGGGGIYNSTSSSPKIKNSIIWGNTTSASSPGIFNFNNSTPAVTDSIVQDSGGSDPLFVTASIPAAPTAEGDYRLSATSPAVNMGSDSDYPANADDTSVFPASPGLSSEAKAAINAALLKDLAGNTPRIQGAAIDMGAYELQ